MGATSGEEKDMTKFLLLTKYGGSDAPPMADWEPGEIQAHLDFLQALNKDLVRRGGSSTARP
jgi:hypothetical protein